MEIIHVSAECYPVAKAGGLGDVVGSLPKYQVGLGHVAKVLMPMYRTKFLTAHQFDLVHEGGQFIGGRYFNYAVIREKTNELGFELYLIDIHGLLDREKVYGYDDDTERFLAFQIAACDWMSKWEYQPDIVHCHDHQAGLIPFMLQHCYAFQRLANVPTIFTIHNAQYQGWIPWERSNLLPPYDSWKWGLLDWQDSINPLASAVRCAWRVTTVSPTYMEELRQSAAGLEALMNYERGKCVGILNGIDTDVWDPATDPMLAINYDDAEVRAGKQANKEAICARFGLDPAKPLFGFIGRLVGEKAADVLPEAIRESVYQHSGNASFLVLGSGEHAVENSLETMRYQFPGIVGTFIGYNETLSHLMYAGADFLLMPSRVEPCGLNQLYALRYGTVPMVRNTGGLRDTVRDLGYWQGYGICFENASVGDIVYSVGRALGLYYDSPELLQWVRSYMMRLNFSWDVSARTYLELYQSVRG